MSIKKVFACAISFAAVFSKAQGHVDETELQFCVFNNMH